MEKEYRFVIHAFGEDRIEAIERAVTMLNLGATFDEVTTSTDDVEETPISRTD